MPNAKGPALAAWQINRERLVQALQGACFGSRQNLPRLRAAVATFVRDSSHQGMDREWILSAVHSALDSGLTPPLPESRRQAFSDMVSRLVEEAFSSPQSGIIESRA